MYIPDTIIDAIMHIPSEEQGQALAAVISYIKGEEVDADALPGSAYAVYVLAKTVLAPRLRRRRAAQAKRAREKTLNKGANPWEVQSPWEVPISERHKSDAMPWEVPNSERHKSEAMEKTSFEEDPTSSMRHSEIGASQDVDSQGSTSPLSRAERRRREREMRKAARRTATRQPVAHTFFSRCP